MFADIKVVCAKDSVKITWRINPELVPYAARLLLGSCMPSQMNVMPTGEGEAQFNYHFGDCKFKKLVKYKQYLTKIPLNDFDILMTSFLSPQIKGKRLIYQNELTFRPQARPKPASFVYPIECVYKR